MNAHPVFDPCIDIPFSNYEFMNVSVQGLNWMVVRETHGNEEQPRGGVLADEMGTVID
jgi:SNF2 family DNA or RNA helicase